MKTEKMKNWIQEHKKEIGLITIGGVVGISTAIFGCRFYERVILTSSTPIDLVTNNRKEVGIIIKRTTIFGNDMIRDRIWWNSEDAKKIGNAFLKGAQYSEKNN